MDPGGLAGNGIDLAVVIAAVVLGLGHGIDWDHIAALTDIAASQDSPRAGLRLGTVYILGHAAVVFLLGVAAIALGETIPGSLDAVMGRVVGWTLIALGVYVIYALFRHGRNFRLRSRWMLVFRGARRIRGAVRRLMARRTISPLHHEHEHFAGEGVHHDGEAPTHAPTDRTHTHRHSHSDTLAEYGTGASLGIGVLHGIGAATPTQVVIFLAAAGAASITAGLVVLVAFLVGLIVSNTAIAAVSSFGFLAAGKNPVAHILLGATTAAASLVLGFLLVSGQDASLPTLFTG